MTQNFDANSTNVTEVRTNEPTNEHTNGRTDERKGENYIPVGINAGGIKIHEFNVYRPASGITVIVLNFRTSKMFAVITLKLKQRGISMKKFVQKVQMEWQSVDPDLFFFLDNIHSIE